MKTTMSNAAANLKANKKALAKAKEQKSILTGIPL